MKAYTIFCVYISLYMDIYIYRSSLSSHRETITEQNKNKISIHFFAE